MYDLEDFQLGIELYILVLQFSLVSFSSENPHTGGDVGELRLVLNVAIFSDNGW